MVPKLNSVIFGRLFVVISTIGLICPHSVVADKRVSAYFFNDSVNGLFISDAYETHNMGLVYEFGEKFGSLDLGIVSPDMHVYRNQYRKANRSFGELISLSLGSYHIENKNTHHKYFVQMKSAGKFGIDNLQDFMHRILGLQPVNKVNDLVRMPNNTWYGLGGMSKKILGGDLNFVDEIGARYYLGTDRAELTPFLSNVTDYKNMIISSEIGLRGVFYDEIVAAPPINANYRTLIPYLELGMKFKYFGAQWYIKDKFSLPTIKDDNSMFGLLSVGVTFEL